MRISSTIRGVFWTAEEQGLLGAKAYHEAHKNGSEVFFFASETDQGAFRPRTKDSVFNFMGSQTQVFAKRTLWFQAVKSYTCLFSESDWRKSLRFSTRKEFRSPSRTVNTRYT